MILALLSLWQQPIEISRSTDRRQLGIMLPIGVMIKDPSSGGGGGNADTLNGQAGSYYLNRTNHTGTQAISTVSGLEEALDSLAEADSDLAAEVVAIQNTLPLKADLVGGVVPTAQIPAIAITELLTLAGGVLPASEAQMLTLRGQTGDFTIRTDVSTQYIIVSGDGSLIGNWLATPQAASPVLSVNGQTGVVVLSRANIGINSSDDIPEGVSNLYWNAQRTRDTTITGFSATNSAITSTDNIVQALGKAQGQIDTFAINSEKTLLHRTLTKFYERKNSGNLSPFDINLRGLFETNYTIPANTLAVGDSFRIEFEVFFYLVTTQTGSYGFSPIINGATVPLSSEGQVPLGILTTHQHIRGHIDFTCYSTGVSGVFGFDGYAQGRNGLVYSYTQTPATYNTTADITVNMSVRFTSAPSGTNTARVVFGRLYKISN